MDVSDNKRIARNAVYLYGRMLLTAGLSLYTARVVLDTLGVANYGLYNLVAGIVTVISFINGTMAGATQRFLNYDMGRGDASRLQRTFSNSLSIHIAIALLVLLLGETVGLWFVNTRLVIAPERMTAANITYQLSLLATMASMVQIPYTASVMAHEKMNVFAGLSVLNVVLKLLVALSLTLFATADTLVAYALLMLAATALIAILYRAYCLRRFAECRFSRKTDRNILRAMLGYSGWDLYGNLSYTARVQGTIVILNNFGGTVLNAAGNLTLTVAGTLTSFAGGVVTAFRPQIIQQYAQQHFGRMLSLIYNCARYAFLLMGLLVVPVFIEMDCLLGLWLKEVPQFTATFCRISLIAACGELLIMVACTGIHATGRIKAFSFISGSLYLLELPTMYLLLRLTGNPPVVYVAHCCFIAIILLADTLMLHRLVPQFKVAHFWWSGVCVPLLIVAAGGLAAWWLAQAMGKASLLRVVFTAICSTASLLSLTYCFGIDRTMRGKVTARIKKMSGRMH